MDRLSSELSRVLADTATAVNISYAVDGCRCLMSSAQFRTCATSICERLALPAAMAISQRRTVLNCCLNLERLDPGKAFFTIADVCAVIHNAGQSRVVLPREKLLSIDSFVAAHVADRNAAKSLALVHLGESQQCPEHLAEQGDAGDEQAEQALRPHGGGDGAGGRDAVDLDAVNTSLVLDSCAGMGVDELKQLVVSLTSRLHESHQRERQKRRQMSRSDENVDKLKKRVSELESEKLMLTVPGRNPHQAKRRYIITLPGTYLLALKQTIGYGGIIPTLKILEQPVSRWTVSRAEHILAANYFSQAANWYDNMYCYVETFWKTLASCDHPLAHPLLSSEMHIAKGDASNAYTLRSAKVFASEFITEFFVPQIELLGADFDHLPEDERPEAVSEARVTFPDLGIVPEHCSAADSRLLWQERFELLGCDHWATAMSGISMSTSAPLGGRAGPNCRTEDLGHGADAPCNWPRSLRISEYMREAESRGVDAKHIWIYSMGTDGGSDQTGCRNSLFRDLASFSMVWLVWFLCLSHQMHLIVERSLRRSDTHGTLAKRTNLWRNGGNIARIFRAWKRLFGPDRAKAAASRLPTRPLKGRWGYHALNERFWLVTCTKDEVVEVYEEVFANANDAKKRKVAEDEDNDFFAQQSRWISEVLRDHRNALLWMLIALTHISRGPIHHFANFLQKAKENKQKIIAGVKHTRSVIQTLVYGEVYIFVDEINNLIFSEDLYKARYVERKHGVVEVSWGLVWSYCESPEDLPAVRADCVLYTLECFCDFHKRVVELCESFPAKLSWLSYKDPAHPCAHRARVAREMLALLQHPPNAGSVMNATAYKIALLFTDILMWCVDHEGCMSQSANDMGAQLCALIERLAQHFQDSTQEIEGYNNIIKHIKMIAPAISYLLLNSRSVNKKSYCLASSRAGFGGLDCKALVQQYVQFHEGAIESMRNERRIEALQGPYMRDADGPQRPRAPEPHARPRPKPFEEYYWARAICDGSVDDPEPQPVADEVGAAEAQTPAAPAPKASNEDQNDVDAMERKEWLRANRCAVDIARAFKSKHIVTTTLVAFEFVLRKVSRPQPLQHFVAIFPYVPRRFVSTRGCLSVIART